MKRIISLIFTLLVLAGCSKNQMKDGNQIEKMVLVYLADNNNLSGFAYQNYIDMLHSELPAYFEIGNDTGDILLVYTRHRPRNSSEADSMEPELLRLSRKSSGEPVVEVLKKYEPDVNSATAETLNEVLSYADRLFTADRKGLVLWSHGTGWVESGQYRSFGYEQHQEINIPDLAEALPAVYDFILFDACLMGGVEVAYELKEKTHYVIASPTEVMGAGFPYTNLIPALFEGADFDLNRVCTDYYNYYMESSIPSATVSLINTAALEQLSESARKIMLRDAAHIKDIDISQIQKYFSGRFHWFYDLRDFYAAISTVESELKEFDRALYNAVQFKLNSDYYFDSSTGACDAIIKRYSGLSTYIPLYYGESEKDEYYKTLAWAKAIGFANM